MRHLLFVLLAAACAVGGPVADPNVSVTPAQAKAGGTVTLEASGFPPGSDVTISAGASASHQNAVARARTDGDGRLSTAVAVPASSSGEVLFVVTTADERVRITSNPVAVAESNERPSGALTITGRVTDEGVECPAVRGDDGTLYTVTGSGRETLRPGARVRITGTVAEISFCQQGTTITATKVEVIE